MTINEDEVQTLADLGLTIREAKVFFALLNCGASTANLTAKASNLPRQDIYKVLAGLQTQGLVERHISTPAKFSAISLEGALKVLLNRRIEKTSDIVEKTETILKNRKAFDEALAKDEEPKFLLIPEGAAYVLRIRKSVDTTRKSIDVISPRNASQGIFYMADQLQNALKRGVKIRFIIDDMESTDPQLDPFRAFIQNPSFQLRATPNHPNARFCVYDSKEVSVVISSRAEMFVNFSKSALLWSDCINLAQAYQDYYDMMWLTSTSIV